ncbi:beta-glucosidase [Ktedonobacter sp. SOSP1-85]|uniref:beta-glucosidase n=1 Tax=Ktedonobacter sp. SOSP1-85 TaxID=2778367 RepID=UPI0019157B32|nr:glycoside hydrolase family 3 C-terminal domain-containing protein [Ktedonobacter sp. SOSP1-85]GHO79416.1 beta-glucosidase [Ktedonobacter sp. SOSP1-85]
MSENIEKLLLQMTLQEKVAMLAGADTWHTVANERLGIPALKVSDGPNGARGGTMQGGVTAACFPCGANLAATWDTTLVERVGQALAQETKTKGARVLLAPTVNIHRSPVGGRNFESFSEDPHLTARMAVAYIRGVQSQGVGATIKHYAGNESEFERYSISTEVDERTLREIYLPPFEAAVREANTWAVMASYNLVNGVPASEHPELLQKILRDEWGFDGIVMSDWFMSVKSTAASVNAGLDLEMPGPGLWRGEKLLQAIQDGEVTEETIDKSVSRLLDLLEKAGKFAQPEEEPEQAIDTPEHRALIREAAAEGMVLLKNEHNVLPLQRETLSSIAIIGPNAKAAQIMGGGSAQVNPHYMVTPIEGILAKVGEQTKVDYEQGCTSHKLLPLLDPQLLVNEEGAAHGFSLAYFNAAAPEGMPVHQEQIEASERVWFGPLPEDVNPQQFAVRATGRFVPQETGTYTFSLVSAGLSRLFIDGEEVIDNWTSPTPGDTYFGMGSSEVRHCIEMQAGRPYGLVLEYGKSANLLAAAVRVGCLPPLPENMIARAATLAAQADVALVFAGLNGEWESEGFDRVDMGLPGDQHALIAKVAEANPNTIVVLNSGTPIAMPWLEKVAAVVQAWYPGQECGNAIADVLFGDVNPSGKLAQTFPVCLEDNPAYINYPGENGKVRYGEGLFVGYRYYDKKKVAPLFPFGFGLSYTSFAYGPLSTNAREIGANGTIQVSLDITNTGERAGKEIVQFYVRDVKASLHRPEKELKAFTKVVLNTGETQTVALEIGREALAYFDDKAHQWVAEAGTFEILVGTSSQDIRGTTTFELTDTSRWL